MRRPAPTAIRAAVALVAALALMAGFASQAEAAGPSVTLPATVGLHSQGIWAAPTIAFKCAPKQSQMFFSVVLTQTQGSNVVSAGTGQDGTCTGTTTTITLQLISSGRVLRKGPALLQASIQVDGGSQASASRTVMLKPGGKDPIVNTSSIRIGATGTVLSRVPVIVSVPVSLRCPVSESSIYAYISVFQRTASGVINSGSGSVSSPCTGQWTKHQGWATISAGRWHEGPAWVVVNDAHRPMAFVLGGKP
jgi:hypothetical protein